MKAIDDIGTGPIGVFDSGYGGLTILRQMRRELPEYDYLYLGDNARAPYGNRSFELVYKFTLQAVKKLFDYGCRLVILACNTASAKALRTIQQNDLPILDPSRRVLGVIRPTVEILDRLSISQHVGIMGTRGTISSGSYEMETAKLHPEFTVTGHACPMWVPLVENGEADGPGADYFVKKEIDALIARDHSIDTIVLACTHYPLLYKKIRECTPMSVDVVTQGEIVAQSARSYLQRHPEMACRCSRGGTATYLTTESADRFTDMASMFMGQPVNAYHIDLQ
ncbi:MAG: glutamate racemase [Clostridiales bacterium]|nr:glutamate racemase [Clostridiales bacterium]